ncbi:amidohydrolase family protein [Roseomonas sp. E05]|uniref:amidohydrolase family protein n=1 Tax=Roseomonas sp. E05 TaxID=3046310 RepID=UPI0024B89836|nr:amidohydrolase family protein [Roseomonas sp. E05]MDJ0387954.1 amidohydrolase family protein [Roseomonas sp. E05]
MASLSDSPFLPVRPDWLALRQEAPLDPAQPIIDPHHHLWDVVHPRYLLDELLADLRGGHNILATVFVECRSMHRAEGAEALRPVGETAFVAGVAAMMESGLYGSCRACAGIVGHADLRLGAAVQPVLEAHLAAGGGRFRGIRHISVWDASPATRSGTFMPPRGLLGDAAFREGFARLGPLGLSFDAWLYHTQLGELLDLARAFPDTVIVLDHVGGPLGVGPYAGQREAVFAAWRRDIQELAKLPNLHVKLGGMAMRISGLTFHEQPLPPSSEQLAAAWKPWVETCIEAFGSARCMFESNFPVDKGMCSYTTLWNAFQRLAAAASAEEKQALFAGTAARVYRLPVSPGE